VVMNVSSAPVEFYATDNKTIIGLNADLARAIGKVLGVPIDIQDVSVRRDHPRAEFEAFRYGHRQYVGHR